MSITGCRKFLSLIPALFLFGWMSVRRPLTPNTSERPEGDSEKADRQPADTDKGKQHLC